MKIICGLGNPGPEYDDTRHNVGWWLLDRLAVEWEIGPYHHEGQASIATGEVDQHTVHLLKPMTYMNRSGAALSTFRTSPSVDLEKDLLVVVDDSALDVGRVRFRARGSAGGHNGLKSIEAALGTQNYARLRIGVGTPPPGTRMSEWVLAPFQPDDEDVILERITELVEGTRVWIDEGIEAAMNRFNR